jgi:tetratricopeptide (TPR) repeat protein
MPDPLTTLSAAQIARFAFEKFIEAGANELTAKFSERAIDKMNELRQKIHFKLQGKPIAEAALRATEELGLEGELEKVVAYLNVAILEDSQFALEVRDLTQEILEGHLRHSDSVSQFVQQSNYGNAVGYQTKVEGGTAYIGKGLNIFHFAGHGRLDSALHFSKELPPNNLPISGASEFVGRDRELATLHNQIQQGNDFNITSILGMAGVGKSELALQYALSHLGSYPGGICWIQARDSDIGIQIIFFARSLLNLNPPDNMNITEQVIFCWQNWVERDTLIVFDDVIDYIKIEQFLPPSERRFKVLITTRSKLINSINKIVLETLQEEESVTLLKAMIGENRVSHELKEAISLCQWLGFLPLGLKMVGRYLARKPDLSLAEMHQRLELKSLQSQALKSDVGIIARWSIWAAIELSWQELGVHGQDLGFLLSLFALAPIPWELVEKCFSDWEEHDLKEQQVTLLRLSLLSSKENNAYQLHPLVRDFLRAKLEKSNQPDGLKQSFCQAMVEISKQFPKFASTDLIESFSLAIPHITEAATTLVAWVDNKDMLWLFSVLGNCYTQQGSYSQAENWYQLCLSTTRSRLGDEHPDVATSLNNLAYLYEAQGRFSEAEALYERALELNQRLLDEEHSSVVSSLNNLAHLYEAQGRCSEAEPLYLKALALNKKLLGEEHPSVAASLNYLAHLFNSQGRYGEAEPLYLQSLELNQRQLGADHPLVASSLSNLASLYASQGRYSESEPLYMQALAIRQQQLGADHPDVASSLNNIAFLYASQGRYAEAEPLYMRSLAIKEMQLGADHPDVATSLSNLASLYASQGRYAEAEPLYMRSLAIKEMQLGADHPDVATSLSNLASLYASQGRFAEAEPLYMRSLAIKEMQLGTDHPDIAISLNNLAKLYESQKRYSEAESLYLRALALVTNVLGENHPNTKAIWQNFLSLIDEIIQTKQIATLSDHPLSQEIISQLTEVADR